MTISEIEEKLKDIAKKIHPRLIVYVETTPKYFVGYEIFDNIIKVYVKFENAESMYQTVMDYNEINKLRSKDELEVDMCFHEIIKRAYLKLLYRGGDK